MAPATLSVLPAVMAEADVKPVATAMDFKPMLNVAPSGMCRSPANPQVAAATAAAMGVLTPQHCVPVITAPWSPGSPTAQIGLFKVLTEDLTCQCSWTGTIQVTTPGETQFTAD